jgi:hypothetical protein
MTARLLTLLLITTAQRQTAVSPFPSTGRHSQRKSFGIAGAFRNVISDPWKR